MPLPDERPRASVANLIGRFEQQNKKTVQAGTGPVIPGRSSSVVSNITGDSVKEAVKEKREWPPKVAPTPAVDPPALIRATPFPTNTGSFDSSAISNTSNKHDVLPSETPGSTPHVAESPAAPVVDTVIQNAQNDSGMGAENTHIGEKFLKSPKSQPAKGTKSPPPSSFRTPSKTPAKAVPRNVSNTASTPALRTQHTGQSFSSTSSTRKSVTPKTAPSTPSRPKTSSGIPSGAPKEKAPLSVARSKTPTPSKSPASTAVPARSKTPSSNLFTPTAASLAKSRNTSGEISTPMRRVTLSSSAADRLSKPTASSLSKARSPPPVTQIRGSPSDRGSTTKPAQQRGTKPRVVVTSKGETKNKSTVGEVKLTSDSEELSVHHEAASPTPGSVTRLPNEPTLSHGVENNGQGDESKSVGAESPADVGSLEQHGLPLDTGEVDDDRSATPVKRELSNVDGQETENGVHDLANRVGTDIEDMVNLLEHTKARPVSIINIPDEVNEIPDED
ncbi:hypothetical protein E1B28_011350 [Marasmius oreades]|uniref:Uncharacterized protein n=1 Tax=Marasmius oreades TaxID=181124 RepID=A0A9P7RUN1_9AGAR|nr:uncharacterized protein E1B28_011350 [Marasmius oreades]KAG7089695.1 hypothetical protein E1B28_011350 [Marasmius oreades]